MTTSATDPDATRAWRPGRAVDVVATLSVHRRGRYDPAFAVEAPAAPERAAVWRTCRPDGGPATVRVQADPANATIVGSAWGPGAVAALDSLPDWLGAADDDHDFHPRHPRLQRAAKLCEGVRIGRTGEVMEALVPAVLEQKVTNIEAVRGWSALLRRFGEPAPGPVPPGAADGLRVMPPAHDLMRIPSWEWHRAGVGPQRSRTIVQAARVANRLAETGPMASADADRRLRAVPGIGVWTSAEVRQRSHGDADAVSVGDHNLPGMVVYALTGEEGGDDARMLELLEPYAGQRHRVCMLLARTFASPPRRAPRAQIRDFRRM